MTQVKVHPHRTYVLAGEKACVSITPTKKYGRAFYVGSCFITNGRFVIHQSGVDRARREQMRNVHAWAVGTLGEFHPEQYPLPARVAKHMIQVTYHYNIGRFIEQLPKGYHGPGRDVTDWRFKAAYFCGRDFYISKD